MIALRLEVSA